MLQAAPHHATAQGSGCLACQGTQQGARLAVGPSSLNCAGSCRWNMTGSRLPRPSQRACWTLPGEVTSAPSVKCWTVSTARRAGWVRATARRCSSLPSPLAGWRVWELGRGASRTSENPPIPPHGGVAGLCLFVSPAVKRSVSQAESDSASALHIYCFLLPTKCLYLWHL